MFITDATSANTIERVVASRTFAVVQTTQGKVQHIHIHTSITSLLYSFIILAMVRCLASLMVRRQSQENGQRYHQYLTMTARSLSVHVTLMELISLSFVRMRRFISEALIRRESLEKHVRTVVIESIIYLSVCFCCVSACPSVCLSVCLSAFNQAYYNGWCFVSISAANNPKPIPYKKIEKVKDVGIISASCGNHTTALLSKEGQLYMFGDLPISGITDEATGKKSLYTIAFYTYVHFPPT